VPYPDIEVTSTRAIQLELDRPTPVRLDGEGVGSARTLSLRVEPDALTVIV
jgi:diacylglycerol kinase family enzyme